ncbi:MAG TPA: GntR family transcriptional regulator, partial [Actinomycetales bacterium]
MTTVPRQTTSPTRTSELLAVLREDVLSGSLEPGAPLRLTALRERYAVGLTPLREALFQLAAEGLVTLHDQRGFRVAQVSQAELADLTEQRVLVEGQALRLSVERGDLAWEGRVLAAAHLLSGTTMLGPDGATPTAAWSEAHRDFHRVLVEACGSVWLLRLRSTLFDHA